MAFCQALVISRLGGSYSFVVISPGNSLSVRVNGGYLPSDSLVVRDDALQARALCSIESFLFISFFYLPYSQFNLIQIQNANIAASLIQICTLKIYKHPQISVPLIQKCRCRYQSHLNSEKNINLNANRLRIMTIIFLNFFKKFLPWYFLFLTKCLLQYFPPLPPWINLSVWRVLVRIMHVSVAILEN